MTRMKRRIRRRDSGFPFSKCTTLDRSASSLPSDTLKSDRRRRRLHIKASLLSGLIIIFNVVIRHGASAACPAAFFAQAISHSKLATTNVYQTKTGVPSAAQCANHCALSSSCRTAVYNHDAQSCALTTQDLVECRLTKQRYNTFHLTTDGAQSLSVLGCIEPCLPPSKAMDLTKNMTDDEQIKNIRDKNLENDVRTSMEAEQKLTNYQMPIVPVLFSHDAIAADGLTFSEKLREPTKTLNFRLLPSSGHSLHPIVPVNSPVYKLQRNIQQQQDPLRPITPHRGSASFQTSGGSASVSPQYREMLREIVGNRVHVDSAESAQPAYAVSPPQLPPGTGDAQGFLRAIQQLNWIQNHLAGLPAEKAVVPHPDSVKARKPESVEDNYALPNRKVEFHSHPMHIEEDYQGSTNAQDSLSSNAGKMDLKDTELLVEATAVEDSSAGGSASMVKTFQNGTESHVRSGGLVTLLKPSAGVALGNTNDDASPVVRLRSHQSIAAEVSKQRSQKESQLTEKSSEKNVSETDLFYPIPEDPIVINGKILTATEVDELMRRERTTTTTTTTVAPWRPAGLIGEDFGGGDNDEEPIDHRHGPVAEDGGRETGFLNTLVIRGLSSMFNNNSENSSETINSTVQIGSATTTTVVAPTIATTLPIGPIVCYRSIQQQALLHATLKSVENVTLNECRCVCADTWQTGGDVPENTEHSTEYCKSLQYDEKTAKCVLNYADHNAKHDLIYDKAVDYYYVSCPVQYLLLTAKRICKKNELASTTEESVTTEANIATTVAETTTEAIPLTTITTPTTTTTTTTTQEPKTTTAITRKTTSAATTTTTQTPTTLPEKKTTIAITKILTTVATTTTKPTTATTTAKPTEAITTILSESTKKAVRQSSKTTVETTTAVSKTSTKLPSTTTLITETPTTRFNKVLKMKESSEENASETRSTPELVAETTVVESRRRASSIPSDKIVSTKRSESAKLTVLTKSTKPTTTTTAKITTNSDKLATTIKPTTVPGTVVTFGKPKFAVKNSGCFEVIDGYAMNNTAGGLEHDISMEECQCFCANSLQSGRYSFQCTSATYYHRERDCILNLANRQSFPEIFVENPLQKEANSQITYLGLTCSPLKAISTHVNKSLSLNGCQKEGPLTSTIISTAVTTTPSPHTDDCFLELPNYVLEGNALIVETNVTIDECKCYCVDAEERYGVLCQSVQYYFDSQTCMLNRENRITEPDRFVLDTESGVQHSYFDYRCHVEKLILSVYVEQVCRQVIELSTKSLLLGHPAAAKTSLLNIDDRSNETQSGKSFEVNSKTAESAKLASDGVNSPHSKPFSNPYSTSASHLSSSTAAYQSVRTSKTQYATTDDATAEPMEVVKFVEEKSDPSMAKFDDKLGETQRYQVRNRLKFVDADGEPPDLFGVMAAPPKADDLGFEGPPKEETFEIDAVDYGEYKSDYDESKLTDVLTNSGAVRYRPPNRPAKGQQKSRQLSPSLTKQTASKSASNRTAIPELDEFDENGSSSTETIEPTKKGTTVTPRTALFYGEASSAKPTVNSADSTVAASTLELNTPFTTEKVFPYPAVGPCRFSALYQTVFNGVRLLKRIMVSSPAQCFAACHAEQCRSANLIHMEGNLKYCELFRDSIVDFRRTDVLGFDRGAVHFDSIQCDATPQK